MENIELKSIDMTAKFSKFQVINKDFTRCRCNIFYTGRNRNYSDITKEALQKFINRKGYANVPVVAHLFKDDNGNYRVGGHDSKIILSSEGIEFIDETVPFGVIPEDCNPSMDLITERSGEQREYFSVDVICLGDKLALVFISARAAIPTITRTFTDFGSDERLKFV